MTQENLVEWLADCLDGTVSDSVKIDAATEQKVLDLANWHGIAPLLVHNLKESGQFEKLPRNLQEQLKSVHYQSVAISLITIRELQEVIQIFNRNNIEFILFKGTPLSLTLYPESGLRTSCDTDILFPDKETAMKAVELLSSAGYQKNKSITGDQIITQVSCTKFSLSGIIHNLDCHWQINNLAFLASLYSYGEISQRAGLLSTNINAFLPDIADSLIIACIHRVSHIPYGESDRLIWLYDIKLMNEKFSDTDWNKFLDRVIEKKLAAIILDSFNKTSRYLNTVFPKEIMNKLENNINKSIYIPDYNHYQLHYKIIQISLLPDFKSRYLYIYESLFPPAEYMYEKYKIKSAILLPILYLIRIFLGIPKLFRTS